MQQISPQAAVGNHDDIHLTEDELFGLLLDGLYHSRVTMTCISDSNSAGEVCVAVANGVVEINPFSAFGLYVGEVSPDGREMI